jgi:hypothetical protein
MRAPAYPDSAAGLCTMVLRPARATAMKATVATPITTQPRLSLPRKTASMMLRSCRKRVNHRRRIDLDLQHGILKRVGDVSGPFGLELTLKLPIYWPIKLSRQGTFCQMTGRIRERHGTAICAL